MAVDELVIKWSMDSKNFNDGITKMNKSMSVLKSEFGATSMKLKNFGSDTDQLKNKQEYLSNAMQIQQQKCEALKRAYDKQVEATGANSQEAETLAIKLNNAVGYYNRLEGELEKTNDELDKQSSKWPKVSEALDKTSDKLSNLGSKLNDVGNKLTLGVTVPVMGAGVAAFNMATDMEESINKVEVACGSGADEVKKFSETTLESFGIAQGSALDMIAQFSDMGTGMGVEQEKANDMSKSLVGLAGDLSSFKNIRVDVAKTALNGIYTGETESLKQLGIVMTEANLQEYALSQGIQTKISDMTQAEKVQLRYNFVLEKTKNAQGDFARTSDGAANQQRIFTESLKEVGATMGEHLLPIGTELITKANEMIKRFGALDDGTQKNIIKIGLFVAALGPALKILGGFSTGLGKTVKFAKDLGDNFIKLKNSTMVTTIATKAMTIAQGALNFVMGLNPIVLVIGLLVALGATFSVLYSKCEWFRDGVNQVWGTITSIFQGFDNWLKGIFTTDWTQSFGAFGNIMNAFCQNASNIWESIKRIFGGIIDFVVGVFTGDWSRAWEGVKNIFGGIMDGLGAVIKAPLNAVIGLINLAISQLNKISFTAPDWVPMVGGKHFGVNLPQISYLEKGGILTQPTFIAPGVMAGEKNFGRLGQAEAVIPLDSMYRNLRSIVRDEAAGDTIIYTTNVFNVDGKELKRETTKEVIKNITRSTTNYKKAKGGLVFG